MAMPVRTGLRASDIDDVAEDDHFRYEIVDGDLFVTPRGMPRHNLVGLRIAIELTAYTDRRGGVVFHEGPDVELADDTLVVPDAAYVRPENVERIGEERVVAAPDLVVEVSSPSTRHLDLGRKLVAYERAGVGEHWFVDLEAERFEVRRLVGGRYGDPEIVGPGETLRTPLAPGLVIEVDEVLEAARH